MIDNDIVVAGENGASSLRGIALEIGGCHVRVVFSRTPFPPRELRAVLDEVKRLDYAALCSRETPHGRGHTLRFCELESQAVSAAEAKREELWAAGRSYGTWLPPRSLNCRWTWLAIKPQEGGTPLSASFDS